MRGTRTAVAVVGAGPAGTSTAISLVRAGYDVRLFDRAAFPRDKCCGDGLTTLALRELEILGFDPSTLQSWSAISEVSVRSPSGYVAQLHMPSGKGLFAATVRRNELDNALIDLARDSGVDVRENHNLVDATCTPSTVTLEFANGSTYHAPLVIGADGMWSPTRRALGGILPRPGPRYAGDWHAYRQYFENVEQPPHSMWVWFDADLLPGYAWSFGLPGGGANVGYGIPRGGPDDPDHRDCGRFAAMLERPHVREVIGPNAAPSESIRSWPIPAALGSADLAGPRVLYVGDAARACDVMTGEGIGQALRTGRLACEAVAGRDPVLESDLIANCYDVAVRETFERDHAVSRLLTRALRHRKGVRIPLRLAGSTRAGSTMFAQWLFESVPRSVATRPSQWRNAVRSRGAYEKAPI